MPARIVTPSSHTPGSGTTLNAPSRNRSDGYDKVAASKNSDTGFVGSGNGNVMTYDQQMAGGIFPIDWRSRLWGLGQATAFPRGILAVPVPGRRRRQSGVESWRVLAKTPITQKHQTRMTQNQRSQIQRCLGRRHRSSKHNQYGLFSAKTQLAQEKMGGTFSIGDLHCGSWARQLLSPEAFWQCQYRGEAGGSPVWKAGEFSRKRQSLKNIRPA